MFIFQTRGFFGFLKENALARSALMTLKIAGLDLTFSHPQSLFALPAVLATNTSNGKRYPIPLVAQY
jgi:hypothetical protein